ncbi:MAG TPA: GTPase HflX [bacterium]|nr:GTPase HflX [bacterium]HOH08043.1 GTPase HflX [bacterium]
MKESQERERAVIVGLITRETPSWRVEDYLDELEQLADTAGAEVIERVVQERERRDPAFMIGRGKAEELARTARYQDADLIIFDDDLTPAQAKNIEKLCGVKIVDRSALILDIFAKHARTREARTQVELAQLQYLLPRLTGQWRHLERQVGGIGVRGPGETQLEVDRRLVRKRVAVLQKELEKIAGQREIRRKNRRDFFKAALVGYTNVGKSTLLNALTEAGVLVEDRLFATLDATVRTLPMDNRRRLLLIDTVGFIRKLPHHLVASFKSTLEESADADLLLHVIDISHPNFGEQMNVVDKVLKELNLGGRPVLKVFNKIDQFDQSGVVARLRETEQPCVFVSAARGIGLPQLVERLAEFADAAFVTDELVLPLEKASRVPKLYEVVEVLNTSYGEEEMAVQIRFARQEERRVRSQVAKILQMDEEDGSAHE